MTLDPPIFTRWPAQYPAVHSRSDKIEKLSAMDLGTKSNVEEGAVVKLGGRYFVIAVSTGKFVCDVNEIMGISPRPHLC